MKVNAIAKKWEPSKVILNSLFYFIVVFMFLKFYIFVLVSEFWLFFGLQVVPQADRVLIRLEELSEVCHNLIQKN